MQADEVETGLLRHDAASMDRRTGWVEHRQVDPREGRMKPRAPNHVGDIEHASIFEHGLAVLNSHSLRNALDSGRSQVLWLDANEWPALRDHVRIGLSSDGRPERQHSMKHDSKHDRRKDVSSGKTLDAKRNVSRISARHPRLMSIPRRLERDLRTGVTRADDENTSLRKLARILVVLRVQLDD